MTKLRNLWVFYARQFSMMEPLNTGNYKKNREPPKNHTFVTKYHFVNVYSGHKHEFHHHLSKHISGPIGNNRRLQNLP